MNKSELCARLAESASIPLDEASKVVEVFFGVIHDALMQEQRVEIRGFCSWKIKEYKSYAGRNPTTGETVLVGGSLASFSCSAGIGAATPSNVYLAPGERITASGTAKGRILLFIER